MKNLTLISAFIFITTFIEAQRSVDALFSKYAGRDGFVTFTMNGDLLKLIDFCEDDEKIFPGDISEVRVLVQDDDKFIAVNFFDRVMKDLNINQYEEFMRFRDSDQDIRMLVKSAGNRFRELVLVGGGDGNFVVQVKGNISYSEAKRFSEKVKEDKGIDIVANH